GDDAEPSDVLAYKEYRSVSRRGQQKVDSNEEKVTEQRGIVRKDSLQHPASDLAGVPFDVENAGPKLPVIALFDDLIRAQQQRRRDRQAKRFRGLEADDQLELRGLFDRHFGRLCALEDPVDVGRGAPPYLDNVRAIAHEAPALQVCLVGEDRRQVVLESGRSELGSVNDRRAVGDDDDGARPKSNRLGKRAFDTVREVDVKR